MTLGGRHRNTDLWYQIMQEVLPVGVISTKHNRNSITDYIKIKKFYFWENYHQEIKPQLAEHGSNNPHNSQIMCLEYKKLANYYRQKKCTSISKKRKIKIGNKYTKTYIILPKKSTKISSET